MTGMEALLNDYWKAIKERNTLQVLLDKAYERLAAAEAVCNLVDDRLTPSFDPKMDDLIAKWMKLKEKSTKGEEGKP